MGNGSSSGSADGSNCPTREEVNARFERAAAGLLQNGIKMTELLQARSGGRRPIRNQAPASGPHPGSCHCSCPRTHTPASATPSGYGCPNSDIRVLTYPKTGSHCFAPPGHVRRVVAGSNMHIISTKGDRVTVLHGPPIIGRICVEQSSTLYAYRVLFGGSRSAVIRLWPDAAGVETIEVELECGSGRWH